MALTDPAWELIDPNPDILSLFLQYNEVFFDGRLGSVVVEWSKRMTSCAGICEYHPGNGFCVVRLSEPLLKFRPRKDAIETLLHEMIHAFLFVTVRKMDRDGHGPDFIEHMRRINNITGLNISVYHTFHDEVMYHQKHVWVCNGPCQFRPPYFGKVRRAYNRAPGPSDFWWQNHMASCNGSFIKIVNEDDLKKAKKVNQEKNKSGKTNDIRNFFENPKSVIPIPMNKKVFDFPEYNTSDYSSDKLQTSYSNNTKWSEDHTELHRPVIPSSAPSTAVSGTLKISTVSNKQVQPIQTIYKITNAVTNKPPTLEITSDVCFTLPTRIQMLFDNDKTVEYLRWDKENTCPHSREKTRLENAFVNLCDDSD